MSLSRITVIFTLLSVMLSAAWLEEGVSSAEVVDSEGETEINLTDKTNFLTEEERAVFDKTNEIVSEGASVTLITAEKEGTSAIVSWVDITRAGVVYKIYRHTKPLSNQIVFKEAKYLGYVGDGVGTYVDSLPQAGRYYYAISAVFSGREYRVLIPDHSYTTMPVNVESTVVKKEEVKPTPVAITNTPLTQATKPDIDEKPVAPPENPWSEDDLKEAVKNAIGQSVVTQYITNEAVVKKAKIAIVSNITASAIEGYAGVKVEWDYLDEESFFNFLVYKSTKNSISSPYMLNSNENSVRVISPYQNISGERHYTFLDMNAKAGETNYYAIVVVNGSLVLMHPFLPNVNYTAEGVYIKPKEIVSNTEVIVENKAVSNVDTNKHPMFEIDEQYDKNVRDYIKGLFYADNFKEVVEYTQEIEESKLITEKTYIESRIFAGRSYLMLREYQKAFSEFSKIEKYVPVEAGFWLDKTIKAMNQNVYKERQ